MSDTPGQGEGQPAPTGASSPQPVAPPAGPGYPPQGWPPQQVPYPYGYSWPQRPQASRSGNRNLILMILGGIGAVIVVAIVATAALLASSSSNGAAGENVARQSGLQPAGENGSLQSGEQAASQGQNDSWAAIVTKVTNANGGLHVDLSLANHNTDWSAMDVAASRARVVDFNGKSTDCGTVFVGTSVFVNSGGWYLPPGFVMKGYTGGTKAAPQTQLLYVECAGASKAAGEKLSISYSYTMGPFNYYVPSKMLRGTFNLSLDKVVTDTKYPVAAKVDSLTIEKSGAVIAGINECTVQLTDVKRVGSGFEFTWQGNNPTQYPAYIHIGEPPVIGADGILYGFYQSPTLAAPTLIPVGGSATWTTTVSVPADVSGFYLLLPLETKQQKYFVDHVIDITDK